MNNCPKCKSSWIGESILDTFIAQRDKGAVWCQGLSDEQIMDYIKKSYGPPYVWKREIGIEIQGKYDGISYYQCPDCKAYFDRFTKKEVDEKSI